jgi:Domain of unknown function (DUF4333)
MTAARERVRPSAPAPLGSAASPVPRGTAMSRRRPGVLLVAVAAVGLTGCSSSIAEAELEEKAAAALEPEIGALPEVRCDEDLAAEVDATTECVAVAPGGDEELPIRITVTSVEDGQAEFDIEPVG